MQSYEQLRQATRHSASVPMLKIRTNGDTQYRDGTDSATVQQYKQDMKDGVEFPPIDTVFDGEFYWVYDGFHRLSAMQRIGKSMVAVKYLEGDKADAQLLALTANANHGLPRNVATKRRIGLAAIANPALTGRTAYDLSKITGLSLPFIKSLSNPDEKVRQQDSRDRSAAKKLKQKVVNPIATDDDWHEHTETGPDPESAPSGINSTQDWGPSEDELKANELAQQADQEMFNKMLEADEPLKLAVEENKRLNYLIAQKDVRIAALMNEKNEAVKEAKRAQSKVDKMYRERDAYKRSNVAIMIDAEVEGRKSITESIAIDDDIGDGLVF